MGYCFPATEEEWLEMPAMRLNAVRSALLGTPVRGNAEKEVPALVAAFGLMESGAMLDMLKRKFAPARKSEREQSYQCDVYDGLVAWLNRRYEEHRRRRAREDVMRIVASLREKPISQIDGPDRDLLQDFLEGAIAYMTASESGRALNAIMPDTPRKSAQYRGGDLFDD